MKRDFFPVYLDDWMPILDAVTPEQGWSVFTACLDCECNDGPTHLDDPIAHAYYMLIMNHVDDIRKKEGDN